MTTYNPVKHQENNYRITSTSTPNHHAPLIGAMSVRSFNLRATSKFLPVGKKDVCFQVDGKYSQASKCVKSNIITTVVDYVLSVNKF